MSDHVAGVPDPPKDLLGRPARGAHMADIQHVGSTAVPGLAGKPVIDIMIWVRSLTDADANRIEPTGGLGYECVKKFEKDTPLRRYFRKDDSELGNLRPFANSRCDATRPSCEQWLSWAFWRAV